MDLGPQFDVISPNRAVRIGGRTYPAVRTHEYEGGGGHANIPMENGNLVSVSHDPEREPHPWSMAHKGGTAQMFTAHNVAGELDRLSAVPVTPSTRAANQEAITQMRDNPGVDGPFPYGTPGNRKSRSK